MNDEITKILEDEKLLNEIEKRGISKEEIERQLQMFIDGVPKVNLISAATIGDGITKISEDEYPTLFEKYEEYSLKGAFAKFVPASGAATRMFKSANAVLNNPEIKSVSELKEMDSDDVKDVIEIFENIEKFAFYDDLKQAIAQNGDNIEDIINNGEIKELLSYLLENKGLGYSDMPKGMIKFHQYSACSRTAFHEHLAEAVDFLADKNNNIALHFTVQEKHEKLIKEHLEQCSRKFEAHNFNIVLSNQQKSTDTIAVTMDNKPFIDEDGSVLFRPGGHGALLKNLNNCNADIVFIKNIDNIKPDWFRADTIKYKQLLGGFFVDIQERIFSYLNSIESGRIKEDELKEAVDFLHETFHIEVEEFLDDNQEIDESLLKDYLDRPLRVCGMVENVGEPGGGPFFIDQEGRKSLQIIEKAQIDSNDPEQVEIMNNSTHFNPVDIVCGLIDHKGHKYDFDKFSDPSLSFIAEKSKAGKKLKAIEKPGLWNGAMAHWNTVFVETPITTFSPIKTVLDLLRKEHQPINT